MASKQPVQEVSNAEPRKVLDAQIIKEAIDNGLLPTGARLICKHIVGTNLYRIVYEEGTAVLPEKYQGQYTKPDYAQEAIREYARLAWKEVTSNNNKAA